MVYGLLLPHARSWLFRAVVQPLRRWSGRSFVPEAYGPQVGGRSQAQQFVHFGCEGFRRLGGAHGCGQDQALWLPQFEGFHGGAGRHAGGKAVVDQDGGRPADLLSGLPPLKNRSLRFTSATSWAVIRSTYSSGIPRRLMTSVFRTRTPPAATAPMPTRLPRGPELARDEYVERRSQRARDLVPHGNPAPR